MIFAFLGHITNYVLIDSFVSFFGSYGAFVKIVSSNTPSNREGTYQDMSIRVSRLMRDVSRMGYIDNKVYRLNVTSSIPPNEEYIENRLPKKRI